MHQQLENEFSLAWAPITVCIWANKGTPIMSCLYTCNINVEVQATAAVVKAFASQAKRLGVQILAATDLSRKNTNR